MRRLLLALSLVFPLAAHAEEPPPPSPTPMVTTAFGYGYSVTSGSRLPPLIIHGAGILLPLSGPWSGHAEIAFATGFTELSPGVQIIAGPSVKMNDRFRLGASGMYKIVPGFDDGTTMHIVGASAAPIFPTSFGSVSFPCGIGYNTTVDDLSIVCNAKATVKLK